MFYRNDAGLAAAELALAVEKQVLESGSIDTIGTVGTSDELRFIFYVMCIIISSCLQPLQKVLE